MAQDLHVPQTVLAELAWEPRVTAAHPAKAGRVTLTGHTEASPHKMVAERAGMRVRGAKPRGGSQQERQSAAATAWAALGATGVINDIARS